MSSSLVAVSLAILGSGLAVTSVACFALWRRIVALTPPNGAVAPPGLVVSVSGSRGEVSRRLEELEARLAKLEASAGPSPIASHPGGPRSGRRVDPGTSATSHGPTLISVPDLASPPSSVSTSEAAAELDRRFGPVWEMLDQGASVDAISRESGYPIGQVELILGLRRRAFGAEAGTDA